MEGVEGKSYIVTGAGGGMGRETANAIIRLLSDLSRFVTGTEIPNDGGPTLR